MARGTEALRSRRFANRVKIFFEGPLGAERKVKKEDPSGKTTYYWGPQGKERVVPRRVQMQHEKTMRAQWSASGKQWDGSITDPTRLSDGLDSKYVFEQRGAAANAHRSEADLATASSSARSARWASI